jgi:hypothetical protein
MSKKDLESAAYKEWLKIGASGKYAPSFGQWFKNVYASDDNPIRFGAYVRTIVRRGRFNPGRYYELTDMKGKFWEIEWKGLCPLSLIDYCTDKGEAK